MRMGGCRSQLSNSNSSKVMKVSESKLPDHCPFWLYRGEHESVKRKLQIASVFLAGSTYENGYTIVTFSNVLVEMSQTNNTVLHDVKSLLYRCFLQQAVSLLFLR